MNRKPNTRNLSLVPSKVTSQLFYFDCGHAALNTGQDKTAVLQMGPKLSPEQINSALSPELKNKVAIACYPAELCARCYPDQNTRDEYTLQMVKAQLKRDRLPIPSDDELRAQIKRQAQKI